MSWKKKAFCDFRLYAVTDLKRKPAEDILRIEQAYRGGADIVQLRSKVLNDSEFLRLAAKVKLLALRYRKLFFVNDRLDLAIIAGADGLHVGQDDCPVKRIRSILRRLDKKLFIGKSTHSIGQAVAAQAENVDYIGVGPVFATPTKPDYAPAGLKFVMQVTSRINIPFVAIGGIDLNNLDQVMAAGARRVAVVRAIFNSYNPCEAAKKINNKLRGAIYA